MKQLLLITFHLLLGYVLPVKAQQNNAQLLAAAKTDTTHILQLLSAGKAIENSNIDTAVLLYKKALALSENIHFDKGIYNSCHYAAFMLSNQGQFSEAVALLDQFVALAIKNKNILAEAKAYVEYGTHYSLRGNKQKQIAYYQKALPLFVKINNTKDLAALFTNMAVVFSQKKMFSEALQYAFRGLFLDLENNNIRNIAGDYSTLASIHIEMKNPDSAKYYLQKTLVIARRESMPVLEVYPLVNLAHLLKDAQPDTAILLAQQALELTKKIQFVTGIIRSTLELANSHIAAGNYAKAITLLTGLQQLYTEQMGLEEKTLIAEALYAAYKGSKNYQKAIEVNDKWLVLNDSAQNEATREGLFDLSEQIENLKHEKTLLLKEAHISKQKNQIIWLGGGLTVAALCGFLFVLYHRARQQAKNKTIETLQKEKELIRVNVQLEGLIQERERISKEIHDEMGASLTSLSLLTQVLRKKPIIGEQPELQKMATISGEMVRQLNEIIWSLNTGNDTVNSLLAYLRHFAGSFLPENSITLQYHDMLLEKDKALDGRVRQHIFFTAKEAIHNIVRHSGATEASIKVSTVNGLTIDIKDNGKGIDFNEQPPFRNGLSNMKKRMEAIGGKLLIQNNNGTLVSIICN
jgi:signal transduction histidine kinase